jgi:hypothetical protein
VLAAQLLCTSSVNALSTTNSSNKLQQPQNQKKQDTEAESKLGPRKSTLRWGAPEDLADGLKAAIAAVHTRGK